VANLAGQSIHVALGIGEPPVSGFGIVTCLAIQIRTGQCFGARLILPREVVVRSLEVRPQGHATTVEDQPIGLGLGRLPSINGVIGGEVAVRASQKPFGMNIPGPVQTFLPHEIHSRLGDPLGRKNLSSPNRHEAPTLETAEHNRLTHVVLSHGVALGTVGRPGPLETEKGVQDPPLVIKGPAIPAPGKAVPGYDS
jgi:hypothetical protein